MVERVFQRLLGYYSITEEHTIPAGGSLQLGYRIIVHAGNADDADIAGEWSRYEKDESG